MSEGLMIAIITFGIPALGAGIWRLRTDLKREREKREQAIKDEALAQARNEHLLRESRATIAQKDRELSTKDKIIARLEAQVTWYESEECPRLKRRIQELSDVITNLSERPS